MSKSKLVFLIIVIGLVVGFIVYPYYAKKNYDAGNGSDVLPSVLLEDCLFQNQPVVLAFSYDAECCPGTEEFFRDYKEAVFKVTDPYQGTVKLIWLNLGEEDESHVQDMLALAQKYNVTHMPSLAIIGATGEIKEIIVGPFDDGQLQSLLDSEVY